MKGITARYKQQLGDVKFDIDLTLPEKGITAVFGRSGAGKTSLINVIAGLKQPDNGLIAIGNKTLFSSELKIDVPVHLRNVGYVFQDARLFPHFKVERNLKYGVSKPDNSHFKQIVQLLALEPLLKRYPHQLSGGEKQRVAIGRALLSKPDILLMDEPLASLDLPRKREVMPFLEQLSQNVEIPIIYVSHSLNEVLRLASHLVVIDEGKVAVSGPIEEVWSSRAMKPWQSFSEQSSLFEARVVEHNNQYALSKVELAPEVALWVQKIDGEIDSPVRLQVRANDVSIMLDEPQRTSIRNVLQGKISKIETHASSQDRISVSVQIELSQGCHLVATITAWARDELELEQGMDVYVQIKGVSVTQRDVVVSN
ncbi:molybdenum ABC transporter ATP-binding protein ModC [Vibrio europaeus]|uniref:molybdenum ABC transporter ATP-binding protein ModC n=1 Tax=Vibrio europaeus TaxID=300876 RepID=UPI00233EDDA9|nr:molybdenum ABC transporter ATP-binding protein ModC [Vibrio europaeus]MDC5804785.1 molybdenum ABC transporter ATP-binding protein ModC [Vibrio europaeus]MDC5827140.1 molybdenum ABC transporter ATP-binding protein ModC [Vibrio europaeus]MDC5832506.1 molybdenum ABC transporter ATP-binding protein ModC [Vibrio europaeus]MDC5835461.1 molybdenum ABC transporter ATP-binding protein ModC [Vibrio europaeus]